MSDLTQVFLTPGQLPDLCNRLVGFELSPGQVGVIATSQFGIEHVAALDAGADVDGPNLLARFGNDVEAVYVVGHGTHGAAAAGEWATALQDGPNGVTVTHAIGVLDQRWSDLRNPEMGGELRAVMGPAARAIPRTPAPSPEEVIERLIPGGPPHHVSELQGDAAKTYVAQLRQVQSPAEQVGTAENILISWTEGFDIEVDLAEVTGIRAMSSTALFCELMESPVVRDAMIASATERPDVVHKLVEASRSADEQAHSGVTTAAGTALWLTGSDGRGPVGSTAATHVLEPVRFEPLAEAVYQAALAGEDPRPVANRVKEASEGSLDSAEHSWVLSQAKPAPSTPTRRPSIGGAQPTPGQHGPSGPGMN